MSYWKHIVSSWFPGIKDWKNPLLIKEKEKYFRNINIMLHNAYYQEVLPDV